jgi:hypothetical protein
LAAKQDETTASGDLGTTQLSVYAPSNFEQSQRAAQTLAASTLVPQQFRNVSNALIAIDMANRLRCSPLMVMQQLYIVQGRPTWSAQFIIAALNSCGRFTPIRFVMKGEGPTRECHAEATDRQTGETLSGPPVSIKMADAEGWINKTGSKWRTMPELMLRYRAGSFFGRLYAPDVLMGLYTQDEALDIASIQDVSPPSTIIQPVSDDDFI